MEQWWSLKTGGNLKGNLMVSEIQNVTCQTPLRKNGKRRSTGIKEGTSSYKYLNTHHHRIGSKVPLHLRVKPILKSFCTDVASNVDKCAKSVHCFNRDDSLDAGIDSSKNPYYDQFSEEIADCHTIDGSIHDDGTFPLLPRDGFANETTTFDDNNSDCSVGDDIFLNPYTQTPPWSLETENNYLSSSPQSRKQFHSVRRNLLNLMDTNNDQGGGVYCLSVQRPGSGLSPSSSSSLSSASSLWKSQCESFAVA